MAEETTLNKVKHLLSSFLTSSGDISIDGGEDTSTIVTNSQRAIDPRNKLLYYQRVETYTSVTWFAMPLWLSPLICARYGWINIDTDMLQCVSCRAFLCAALPADRHTQQYKDCCAKLKPGLQESHKSMCKWASNPSPEWYMKLPLEERGELLSDLQHRLHSLTPVDQLGLSLNLDTITSQGLSTGELERLLSGITVDGQEVSFPSRVLAFTGWMYCESQLNVFECQYCRRKVGIWTLTEPGTPENGSDKTSIEHGDQRLESSEDGGDEQNKSSPTQIHTDNSCQSPGQPDKRPSPNSHDEPVTKKRKLDKQTFDPLSEHRFWCPWLQSTKQEECFESGKSLPAWLRIAQMLGPSAENYEGFSSQMKKSPRLESLRHLRRVLQNCTSPQLGRNKNGHASHPVT